MYREGAVLSLRTGRVLYCHYVQGGFCIVIMYREGAVLCHSVVCREGDVLCHFVQGGCCITSFCYVQGGCCIMSLCAGRVLYDVIMYRGGAVCVIV